MSKPVIVCAAIRHRETGVIIASPRHFDMIAVGVIEVIGKPLEYWADAEQGFIDQFGTFYSREDARVIALEMGKKPELKGTLFSEDLY